MAFTVNHRRIRQNVIRFMSQESGWRQNIVYLVQGYGPVKIMAQVYPYAQAVLVDNMNMTPFISVVHYRHGRIQQRLAVVIADILNRYQRIARLQRLHLIIPLDRRFKAPFIGQEPDMAKSDG